MIGRGAWKHYKGTRYTVIGTAKHSETLEPLVIYVNPEGDFWARPEPMWEEHVETDTYKGPRFVHLGESAYRLVLFNDDYHGLRRMVTDYIGKLRLNRVGRVGEIAMDVAMEMAVKLEQWALDHGWVPRP